RKIAFKDRMIRKGEWNLHSNQLNHRMKGAVLGLIGYGAIAKRFHEKTSAFGFSKVLVYDPFIKREIITNKGASPTDLNILLSESDYISIHVPLNDTSKKMIGEKQLNLMKKNSILINTSRGGVIDQQALIDTLQKKQIAGAGLDVFEKEPIPNNSPLLKLDNVTLSDHTGWYSEESLKELKTKAAINVLAVLKGGQPIYPVNNL
ncbi:MAG: C-terminal binding protein, partial [Spirochaetes bacterium]